MSRRSKQRRQRQQLAAKTAQVQNPAAWLQSTAETERWTIPQDGALYSRQAELFQRLSWVRIAVSVVSQAAATIPFSVKKMVGEKLKDIPNHAFETLLRRPNPLQSRFEFLEAVYNYYRLTGNAYIWLNRAGPDAEPVEMWVLPSHRVLPVPDGRLYLRGYMFTNDHGQKIPLETWEVVHLKSFHPLDSFVGLSPVEAFATVAVGDIGMQEWNTNFFARDHAKSAGILAFADAIDDPTWQRMDQDAKRQGGGTKRAMMRLRGVGKGGVEWIAMNLSQKDMEFLQARNFNKEEIYSIYAPGLASVLAVNATEANATAGESTMQTYALYPLLVAFGEKLTNDVLPAYGPDLVGSFDDPRRKDRALELQEQEAFERTHTIDEVREKYYEASPIGDDRGELLPKEIGSGRTSGAARAENAASDQAAGTQPILGYHIEQGVVGKNESRATLGLPPVDETEDLKQRKLKGQLEIMKAATDAGLDTETAARLAGIEGVVVRTVAPPPPRALPAPAEEPADPMADHAEHEADPEEMQAADLERWERKAVKAVKAGRSAAVKFDSTAIEPEIAEQIREGLAEAAGPAEVREVFAALKAQVLTPIERALADKIAAIFQRVGGQTVRDIIAGADISFNQLDASLRSALLPAILEYALATMADLAEEIGPDFDPAQMMTTASQWAQTYTFDLVKGLTDTTRTVVQDAIAAYTSTPGMTREALEQLLRPAFGLVRSEMIAVSEITRSASASARMYQAYLAENGLAFTRRNVTNADDRVCSICGPLNGKTEADWPNDQGPPWHPRCRCAVTLTRVKP
jgi:HK97 family phage portal protein